jgi:putative methyltransferase
MVLPTKKNCYLVDLGTGTDRSLMPLGCGLIASYARTQPDISESYNISIHMLGQGLDELMEEIVDPDVVGLACYVWNFFGNVELSRRIKERYPNCLIVWGGPAIPQKEYRIKEFFESYKFMDLLVQGEGELTFSDILQRRLRGESLESCAGVSLRAGKGIKIVPQRPRIQDFTIIPSPFLNGIFDDVKERYGDHIVGVLWETSRGCPFQCEFCDWGSALVKKINRLDVDRVLKEIEWTSQKKIHYVYATDANFGISYDRDLEIAKGFVEISKRNGFPNTLILNWSKNSHEKILHIAEVLRAGGITTNVTLSYQSLHPPTLEAISRKNIRLEDYHKLKEKFHQEKLPTYTELILPLPEETLASFLSGMNHTLGNRLEDQLSVYPCVLLENTEMATPEKREKYGLETRKCAVGLNRRRFRYERFGEDEVLVATRTMPLEDWKRAYEVAFCTAALYNLRVAFFPMIYLRHRFGVLPTDFIQALLGKVDEHPEKYRSFAKAVAHLRNNRQLILDNVSSVSPVEGGDGVSLTPHEAMLFLLLNDIDTTYTELHALLFDLLDTWGFKCSEQEIEELVKYQKARMPVWNPLDSIVFFSTNIPTILEALIHHEVPPEFSPVPTKVTLTSLPHNYKTEREYNIRRVACGYTLNIQEAESVPLARNTNLAGSFS